MRTWFLLCGLSICMFACRREMTKLPGFIEIGRGITNEMEVGMTLCEVKKKRGDIIVTKRRTERWPFGRVIGYAATIPGSGISFEVPREDAPITRLVVNVDPKLITNRFFGKVSCQLWFGRGDTVSRKKITEIFGEPAQPASSNILSELRAGKNVAWIPSAGIEILYYPRAGIIFHLRGGLEDEMTITKPPADVLPDYGRRL